MRIVIGKTGVVGNHCSDVHSYNRCHAPAHRAIGGTIAPRQIKHNLLKT